MKQEKRKMEFQGSRLFFGGLKWLGWLMLALGLVAGALVGPSATSWVLGLNTVFGGLGMVAVGLIGQLVAISASNIVIIREIAQSQKVVGTEPLAPSVPQLWK